MTLIRETLGAKPKRSLWSAVFEGEFPPRKDLLPGGKGDNLPISAVDPKQLAMGIEVEMEHTKNRKLAREIALDHLAEDPRYYTKLKRVHKESAGSLFGALFGETTKGSTLQRAVTALAQLEAIDWDEERRPRLGGWDTVGMGLGRSALSGKTQRERAKRQFQPLILQKPAKPAKATKPSAG